MYKITSLRQDVLVLYTIYAIYAIYIVYVQDHKTQIGLEDKDGISLILLCMYPPPHMTCMYPPPHHKTQIGQGRDFNDMYITASGGTPKIHLRLGRRAPRPSPWGLPDAPVSLKQHSL